MKKLFLKIVSAVCVVFCLAACTQDFGSDITALTQKVEELNGILTNIQNEISAGAVITNVESTDNGVVVTLNNGETFAVANGKDGENGLNGQTGAPGKDGTVWSIGENGNWFYDNGNGPIDSGKPSQGAQGIQGTPGIAGTPGANGEDGTNGDWYYPCTDKTNANYGKWIKVNGETSEESATDSEWLPYGTITAVWENDELTLHNVEGVDGPLVVNLSRILKSIAVIPESVVLGLNYPVVDAYTILDYESEKNLPVSAFTVKYRVNPAGADMEGYEYHVIDRKVTTRAEGDERGSIVPKVVVAYDGKDELVATGYIDYAKYQAANSADGVPARSNYSYEASMSIFALEAAKDSEGKEAVVSDYAMVNMNYVLPEWKAYSRHSPDQTPSNWDIAPCEANNWYSEEAVVNGMKVVKYQENDAIQVNNTYDVAEHMRFEDPWSGKLEDLGFTVNYSYEIYDGFGAAEMVNVTPDGIVSVKDKYKTGAGLAGAIGQYFMVTAKAAVVNMVGGDDAEFEAQYVLIIVPDNTEAVTASYDLGKFNYSQLRSDDEDGINVPMTNAFKALGMNADGFKNIYTSSPAPIAALPAGFTYEFNYGADNMLNAYIYPLAKIGKNSVTLSFVPNSEEYPVLNYTISYEIVFDIVAPVLNPDYVLYDEDGALLKTVITPDLGVDSIVAIKGKVVLNSGWRPQSSIKEHILDYGQYIAPSQPNIDNLSMKINYEKSNQPEKSAEIFSTSVETDMYKYQEFRVNTPLAVDEPVRDYVVDMYITLLNGEQYMVKEYIVRFANPFAIVADDIVLETHRVDECTAQAFYKVIETQNNGVLYDSETNTVTDLAMNNFPGVFSSFGIPVWTLNADESFGNNLICESDKGVFHWLNNGGSLQKDKETTYTVTQDFSVASLSGIGKITVKCVSNSQSAHN